MLRSIGKQSGESAESVSVWQIRRELASSRLMSPHTGRLRPSRYVTSQLGQLSLASFQGRLTEYQLRLGQSGECHLCRVAGNTVILYGT